MVNRCEYLRGIIVRVLELTQPAPRGYWADGRAWVRLNQWVLNSGLNQAADDFLAGRTDKQALDAVMLGWVNYFKLEYQSHQHGIPL